MARPRRTITMDGKAWCSFHAQYEPVEDFDWNPSRQSRNGSVSALRTPKANCRLAEQTIRDHGKEADPARAAIEGRAKDLARKLSGALGHTVGYHFVLIELNWRFLVPILRAMLGPDGGCLNCGKHRDSTRNLHIEHRVPPLKVDDWPAQHARNLWIACGGCNGEKARSEADRPWLDREMRKWMIARNWAEQAGQRGWPPYDPTFGQPPVAMPDAPLTLF